MKGKLSIIIPVYNDEDYLKRCLDSIISLNYHDLEVILVDDGSTDSSLSIMRNYAHHNECIKIISQPNRGVSSARNMGLSVATGEYVMFVDADDYLLSSFEIVLNEKQNADLTIFGFESGNKQMRTNAHFYDSNESLTAKVMMMKNPTRYLTAWGKILRNDLIKNNHLRFNTNLRVAEDGNFMLLYLKKCKTIRFSVTVGYHYSKDTESVMTTFDHKSEDYLMALEESERALNGCPKDIKKAFNIYVMMHFNIIMVHETFASANCSKYSIKIHKLKKLANEPIFKEALKEISISECKGLRMLPVILLKLKAYRLASLLFIIRAKQNESLVNEN